MGKSRQQQIDAIVRKVESTPGWSITRGRHSYKIKAPGGAVIFMTLTPSDHRAIKNVTAVLRRAGLNI